MGVIDDSWDQSAYLPRVSLFSEPGPMLLWRVWFKTSVVLLKSGIVESEDD